MFTHEYALLIAVVLPALVVLAMQMLLLALGERGTLLLPATGQFPPVLGEDRHDLSHDGANTLPRRIELEQLEAA